MQTQYESVEKGKLLFAVDSPKWFDPKENEKALKEFWSAPSDARFPQCNQTRHCFMYYVDYHRCKRLKGEDYAPCEYFKRVYGDVCPTFWTEKWDQWIDEGRFPYKFEA